MVSPKSTRVNEQLLAWLLLIILALIVLHAPLTVYVATHWPAVGLMAKGWKEWLMGLATVLLVVQVSQLGRWRLFTRDRLFWLIIGFAVLHGIMLLVHPTDALASVAGIAIDLRYILYFALVYGFLRLYPHYSQSFLKVAVLGACIVVGFATLQVFLPVDSLRVFGYGDGTIQPYLTVDENHDYIRHSSTLRGPNPLGAYAVMVLAAVVAAGMQYGRRLTDKRLKLLHVGLALGGCVALWVSYSRSAVLGLVVALVALVVTTKRIHVTKRMAMLGMVVAVGLVVVWYAARDTSFVRNVILHDNPTTGARVDSNTGHANSLADGVQRVIRQPLGAGVGSTGSASLFGGEYLVIENQYLLVAHEVGWLGLLLFVSIFVIVLARLLRLHGDWMARAALASGLGLATIGLLLPVWVDDTVSIVWWGLAAVILAKGATHGTTSNQKTA